MSIFMNCQDPQPNPGERQRGVRRDGQRAATGWSTPVVAAVAVVLVGFCLIGAVGVLGIGGWLVFRNNTVAPAMAKAEVKAMDQPAAVEGIQDRINGNKQAPGPPEVKLPPAPEVKLPPAPEVKPPPAFPDDKKPTPVPKDTKPAASVTNDALTAAEQALPGGGSVTFVNINGSAALVGNTVWNEDGKSLFILDANGVLRRIRVDGWVEERRADLGGRAAELALSGAGLVVAMTDQQEVWVVDPRTLEVTARHKAASVRTVVSAPKLKLAVAGAGGNNPSNQSGLLLINLEKPDTMQSFNLPSEHLAMSPDGKYLFAQGGIEQMFRYRLDGNNILKEDETPRIAQNGQGITVSPDGKYVCLPSGGGNYQNLPDHPPISPYTTYVYPTDNLRRPAFTIASGAYPRAVGFDPAGGHVFAQNRDTPLIVYSMAGIKQHDYKFGAGAGARDEPREFNAHPQGNMLVVRFEKRVALVKPPAAAP